MISKRELDGAIYEIENSPTSYQNCEKLATFYTIRQYCFPENEGYSYDEPQQVAQIGETEFLQAVSGMDTTKVLTLMDELMSTVQITNPRLYNGVMRRIKGQE